MCLAVPGKILDPEEGAGVRLGRVDFGGATREACLEALPEAKVGEYTIVHAGFALSILSEEDAQETLRLLRELSMIEDEFPVEDVDAAASTV